MDVVYPFSPGEEELIEVVLQRGVDLIWVIYPASPGMISEYFPELDVNIGPTELRSFGQYSGGAVGIKTEIITIFSFPGDFIRDELVALMDKIQAFAARVGARGVALAGVLPGLFFRFGVPIEPPCVTGALGTVYAIVSTLQDALQFYGKSLTVAPIRVLGFGSVGQSCLRELKRLGCEDLIVIEKQWHGIYRRQGVLFTNSEDFIREGNWVIFVAGGGHQIDIARYPAIFGINDMYPSFSQVQLKLFQEQRSKMFEVALRVGGVVSSLPIEQFAQDQFPGCMGQGLVQASGVDTSEMEQSEFNAVAWNLGIRSGIYRP